MAEYGSFGSGLASGYLTSSKQRQEQEALQAAADAEQAKTQVERSTAMMEKTVEVANAYREAIARTPPGAERERLQGALKSVLEMAGVLNNQLKVGTKGAVDFSSVLAAGADPALAPPSPIVEHKEGITTQQRLHSGAGDLRTFKRGKKYLNSGKDLIEIDLDVDDPTAKVIHTGSADQTNVERLQSYRAKLVAANPNDPQIAAVDDAIKKATTFKPAAGDALAIQQLQDYRATLPPGDERIPAVDAAITKLTTHKPTAPPKTSQYIAGPTTPKNLPRAIQRDSSNPDHMDYVERNGYIKTSTVQQTSGGAEGGLEGTSARDTARTQVDYLSLGDEMLGDLIGHLERDPTSGGVVGALRRIGQKVQRGLGEVTQIADFGIAEAARGMITDQISADVAEGLDSSDAIAIRKEFLDDPTLSEIEILENSLAAIVARVLNPKDRLLRDQYEVAKSMVKVTGFSPGNWSSQTALEKLRRLRQDLQARKASIRGRISDTPEESTTPTGPTVFNYDSEGNLID
tara:strand:+ start:335 stop:1885 length:1551 start_codon:yes stop_codon:yes gene_type:complete